jgi:hypothetical protein
MLPYDFSYERNKGEFDRMVSPRQDLSGFKRDPLSSVRTRVLYQNKTSAQVTVLHRGGGDIKHEERDGNDGGEAGSELHELDKERKDFLTLIFLIVHKM